MAEMAKAAEMAKTAKMFDTAKMAKTGLGRANSDDPLAFLKNKGQGRVIFTFYWYNQRVHVKTAMQESLTRFTQKYSFEMKEIQFPINSSKYKIFS